MATDYKEKYLQLLEKTNKEQSDIINFLLKKQVTTKTEKVKQSPKPTKAKKTKAEKFVEKESEEIPNDLKEALKKLNELKEKL